VDLSVRLGRLAVQTGVFPLYEVVNGKYKITVEPSPMRPVQDYLKPRAGSAIFLKVMSKKFRKEPSANTIC